MSSSAPEPASSAVNNILRLRYESKSNEIKSLSTETKIV